MILFAIAPKLMDHLFEEILNNSNISVTIGVIRNLNHSNQVTTRCLHLALSLKNLQ
jgi:hypothetical protein